MSKDITIDEYAKEVINELRAYSSDFDHAQVFKRIKNNDIELTAIQAEPEGPEGIEDLSPKISPNLYVDYYFENGYAIDEAAKELFDQYQKSLSNITSTSDGTLFANDINVDDIMKFENAKPNIFIKLINTKQNTRFLNQVPSIPFGDLSITFAIIINNEDGIASINISNELLRTKDWAEHNVSVDTLLECGIKYVKNHTIINSMLNTMKDLRDSLNDNDPAINETIKAMEESGNDPMIVFSTDTKTFGASTMIVSDILQEIKNRVGGSYYILPSSIHELIALPVSQLAEILQQNGDEDVKLEKAEDYISERIVKDLRDMIREVNENEVPPKDILSGSLYYYDADTDKFYYFEENDKQVEIDNLY